MEKCLDNRRFHIVEGDTDSFYFDISGDKNEGINQRVKHIMSEVKFYNENVYKWLPKD
jgi:DNA polymerase elongation subunit (family B)